MENKKYINAEGRFNTFHEDDYHRIEANDVATLNTRIQAQTKLDPAICDIQTVVRKKQPRNEPCACGATEEVWITVDEKTYQRYKRKGLILKEVPLEENEHQESKETV